MTRKEAIKKIEELYPPDSEYVITARIGQELLDQAKRELQGWRTEPDDVIIRFALLCKQRNIDYIKGRC